MSFVLFELTIFSHRYSTHQGFKRVRGIVGVQDNENAYHLFTYDVGCACQDNVFGEVNHIEALLRLGQFPWLLD